MSTWTAEEARAISAPDEVRVAPRRADGSLRSSTIIWIVAVGDRVFIRSANGPDAAWYRAARRTGSGQLLSAGTTHEVSFTHSTDERDLAAVDAAYRATYRRYASIVDNLNESTPRSATLEVTPATANPLEEA